VSSRFKRISRAVLGGLFLGLGVIGLFPPFLQGILFLVIGLTLLGNDSVYARRWLEWVRARVPHRFGGANPGGELNG
jgi:uncharacterized membrane protein YbaN (DUF454 family)